MSKPTLQEALQALTPSQRAHNFRLHTKWKQYGDNVILGNDDEGMDYAHNVEEGMWWRITPCCGASDKGVEDGVVCRSCYGWIPDEVSAGVVIDGVEISLFGKPVVPLTREELARYLAM